MAEVTLTIDGQQVTVPEGTLVIRAAERAGIEIPRFCDHPLLAPVGACRQCLVDIPDAGNGRGFPKPQASCTIPVAEGMVVNTDNAPAAKAQAGIMEFLLINHPLDCPVCDKGGECPLQNQAMSVGRPETRFLGNVKRTYPKPINVSANILLDRERCVLCARCTRFSEQIAGDPSLVLIERGGLQQVGTADDRPYSSYFSGNVIQICPVGALTSAEYRFRSRPFDLVSTPSVAEHDSCGAVIRVDHRRGVVQRRLAGNDPAVNEEWISDKDRFCFRYADLPDRLAYPMVRDEGELRPASWLEAVEYAARGLAAAGPAGVLPGGRVTLEDARAYVRFAREVLGTDDVDFRSRPLSAEETTFLRDRVRGSARVTYADLEAASDVVLVGLEPEDEAATIFLRLRKAALRGRTRIRVVAPYLSEGSRKLHAELVRCAPGDEAATVATLGEVGETSVILAGERLAISPGALSAVAELAQARGAQLAWVPRRAGDRGAIEAGCLPLTGGRDADAIVAGVLAGELGALVVGGVDPDDTADPAAFRAALEAARFVVSLEVRASAVSAAADVVFPVAPVTDKAGTFVTWEGRERPFPRVFDRPASYSDARVLELIGEAYDRVAVVEEARQGRLETSVGFETVASATSSTSEVPSATSSTTEEPSATSSTTERAYRLATWRLLLDNGTLQQGDKFLAATARPAVVRLPRAVHEQLAGRVAAGGPATAGALVVTITGDRGSWTLPAQAADLPDDTVWVPMNSHGRGVLADLASPGSRVDVERFIGGEPIEPVSVEPVVPVEPVTDEEAIR